MRCRMSAHAYSIYLYIYKPQKPAYSPLSRLASCTLPNIALLGTISRNCPGLGKQAGVVRYTFILCVFAEVLKWCQRRDLNPRPKAYESSALPLSYSGKPSGLSREPSTRCQLE